MPGFDRHRLRSLREAAGLTRRQVGDAAGVHQIMVRQWETGHRIPAVEMLGSLAQALGVSPLALTDRADLDPACFTLRDLRVACGLTQQQVADAAGMVRTTYSSIERGQTARMTDVQTRSLAAVFGVSANEVHAAHMSRVETRFDHRDGP